MRLNVTAPGNLDFDFSHLNHIKPYPGDHAFRTSDISFEDEIAKLNEEIAKIDLRSIPFDKWDYIMVFALAIIEIAQDFLIADHNFDKSLAHKDSDFSKWLNSIHSGKDPETGLKLDEDSVARKLHDVLTKHHRGSPMDYQGPHFGGGNHRARTFSHDVLMFLLAIYMISQGKFIDGYYENGKFIPIITGENQYGTPYETMSLGQAMLEYVLHMLADLCSNKSLPIPGFSLLTHAPNREIRKLANDLYHDGLNMRNLFMQAVPVATVELIMWIYTHLKYHKSDYSKEQIKNKKEKMLLLTHGISTAVNVGKVIITKNPTSLNLVMIMRTVQLVWKVLKHEIELNHQSIRKVNLGVLKNKLETAETLILLDETIYYTKQIDQLIANMKQEFDQINFKRQKNLSDGFSELDAMLEELKKHTNETGEKNHE